MSVLCDAGCGRRFKAIGSMHKHLTSSTKCGGYLQGKLRDLGLFDDDGDEMLAFGNQADPDLEWDGDQAQEVPYYEPFHFEPIDLNIDESHFIPPEGPASGSNQNAIPGPGPSTAANSILRQAAGHQHRVFEVQEDSGVTVWTDEAGHVLRKDAPPMYDVRDEQGDVQMAEGDVGIFHPFSSELDWRVAQWAIKDGPGHSAFDRLLEIPGVRQLL